MSFAQQRRTARLKRRSRVRRKITGAPSRPRLCVFRSSRHIYAQIIEDTSGKTLVAVSTLSGGVLEDQAYPGNVEAAKAVGKVIAQKALEQDIKEVVFDRNGFLYHGRVKALADSAREAGLVF